jgi:hypothetical protein
MLFSYLSICFSVDWVAGHYRRHCRMFVNGNAVAKDAPENRTCRPSVMLGAPKARSCNSSVFRSSLPFTCPSAAAPVRAVGACRAARAPWRPR